MKLTSSGIVDGKIDERFGKKGTQKFKGMPSRSLPFEIADAPADTKCFAVVLDDKDAVKVCGFTWIHWLVSDLTETSLPENASEERSDLTQGCTSEHSAVSPLSCEDATRYVGMAPPDKPHRYDLTVYALDEKLGLAKGFTYNELWYAMKGHILAVAELTGVYDN